MEETTTQLLIMKIVLYTTVTTLVSFLTTSCGSLLFVPQGSKAKFEVGCCQGRPIKKTPPPKKEVVKKSPPKKKMNCKPKPKKVTAPVKKTPTSEKGSTSNPKPKTPEKVVITPVFPKEGPKEADVCNAMLNGSVPTGYVLCAKSGKFMPKK